VLLWYVNWHLLPRNVRRRLSRRRHRFRSNLGFRLLARSIRRCFPVWRCRSGFVFRFSRRFFDRWGGWLACRRHHVRSFIGAFVLFNPLIVDWCISDGRAVR